MLLSLHSTCCINRRFTLVHFSLWGCRGLMVKASGWQSFDRQLEPYLRAFMAAPLWCGLGCRSRIDGKNTSIFFGITQHHLTLNCCVYVKVLFAAILCRHCT